MELTVAAKMSYVSQSMAMPILFLWLCLKSGERKDDDLNSYSIESAVWSKGR